MDQVWDAWTGGDRGSRPGHPIVISFDNGYTSQYHVAMPVLRHYHWLGVENIQLTGLPRSQGGLSRRPRRSACRAAGRSTPRASATPTWSSSTTPRCAARSPLPAAVVPAATASR